MSYENPRIIIDKSGMILAEGIANFGKYAAQGLTNYYANRERIQKENDAKDNELAKISLNAGEQRLKNQSNFEQKYGGKVGYDKAKELYKESAQIYERAKIRAESITDLDEINALKETMSGELSFQNNIKSNLIKLAGEVTGIQKALGEGKEYGFNGIGTQGKLVTQSSLNTLIGGPGFFTGARNGNSIDWIFEGDVNGQKYQKIINGANYANSPDGMSYDIINLSQEGAEAVTASLLEKNGNIKQTSIIGNKIIDAPLQVINKQGGKMREQGATMPIEIINIDKILISRQADIKAQSFYNSLNPSQKEDTFNSSFNFASPDLAPNGFKSYEDFQNKTKQMPPNERVQIVKAALEQTILDDTLRQTGIGTYLDAETGQDVYYRQSGQIQAKPSVSAKATKQTAGEKKEITRVENLQQTVEDIDNLFLSLDIKKNPAGIYKGSVDMNDLATQERIIQKGFSVKSVTAKQTEEEKDEGIEPEIIGYELKDESTGKAFEVPVNVAAPIFMQKVLLSRGAKRQEADKVGFSFAVKPQLP